MSSMRYASASAGRRTTAISSFSFLTILLLHLDLLSSLDDLDLHLLTPNLLFLLRSLQLVCQLSLGFLHQRMSTASADDTF